MECRDNHAEEMSFTAAAETSEEICIEYRERKVQT